MSQPLSDRPPEEKFDDESLDEASSSIDLDFDADTLPASMREGAAVIRRFVKTLPNSPGVYRMTDAAGAVLYVGKAKNLKKRVTSYTRATGHSSRIARMIAGTASMEFITTHTETEALLLEANLIKQLRPRFNVLMRDDKSFPYILIAEEHESPQLTRHRGARNRKGSYYGPFASAWAVKRTIDTLQKAFLIRTCTDSFYASRRRPCLLYQIKRCAGPCTGEVSPEDYKALVNEAKAFLTGRSSSVKERLGGEMQAASDAMEFERAARLRDRLAALSSIQSSQDINPHSVEEADVFALQEEAGQFCIEVFFFRNWQNWGNRAYFPKADRSMASADILNSFIAQFYDDKPPPKLILLSHEIEDAELLAAALASRAGHGIDIAAPKRGERRDLVLHAARNAKEALSRKLADSAAQEQLLAALGKAFGLERAPRRIEVYDNSHIMGTNAVGGMIVAGASGFMKTHYRTFNIASTELTPGDDYGMMREVLSRRFARLMKEAPRPVAPEVDVPPNDPVQGQDASSDDPGAFPAWPDLVLIDGGKGQLEAARAAMAEVGVSDVPLVSIAKGRDRDAGRETFFMVGREPFRLPPRDPALYFVQRLRDEAHRFAIGTHRARRKRDMTKSPLDEISGIGPRRKKALLLHFGTAKAIARASLEDLSRAPGINAATAKAVYDFFRDHA